ncbi:DNA polymerase alpha/epsilon subunit B [Penicillium angulare]|uniref:DNA-directed DNA polymerase n=1 Tax=Penicillium angulare TaxID=116970 RepID=A0A9W9KJU1_9EURO|nr:DNA polymerase alpha/epsilon subunit B [Penicillium angulare]
MAPNEDFGFLRPPSDEKYEETFRSPSNYKPFDTFNLPPGWERKYNQQYGDIYHMRLAGLKPATEKLASDSWEGFTIAGERAFHVRRVLDVRQGQLCWVTGTVYKDMPLKPNILVDLTAERFTPLPAPRPTYIDPANPGLTQTVLEDASGRVRLGGHYLSSVHLTTGITVTALGTENAEGVFEVIEIKVPDLAPQPERWEKSGGELKKSGKEPVPKESSKIAFISGLSLTGTASDGLALDLLTDYLLGYTGFSGNEENSPSSNASKISRLIIAGNSLAKKVIDPKKPKSYRYNAADYNAKPITRLDNFLAEILPSIPVTLMPGETDPANVALPQQGLHRALFPQSRAYCPPPPHGPDHPDKGTVGWFDSVTNPWQGEVEGWRLWGTSGQNVEDALRYLDFSDEDRDMSQESEDSEARMQVMEAMLRWRIGVPTAPDTIWTYPFTTVEPYVFEQSPHLFFTGCQPSFKTAVIQGDIPVRLDAGDTEMADDTAETSVPRVRLLAIPRFKETGELILVDSETLEVEVVRFGVFAGQEDEDEKMTS